MRLRCFSHVNDFLSRLRLFLPLLFTAIFDALLTTIRKAQARRLFRGQLGARVLDHKINANNSPGRIRQAKLHIYRRYKMSPARRRLHDTAAVELPLCEPTCPNDTRLVRLQRIQELLHPGKRGDSKHFGNRGLSGCYL